MPETFEPADHGLSPIHVEDVGGVLYVCLADDPPDIADFRRQFEPMLAAHNLRDAKVAFESTLVERGNWKLVMENARECYHCATSHPELARSFPTGASAHFDYGEDRRQEFFADGWRPPACAWAPPRATGGRPCASSSTRASSR